MRPELTVVSFICTLLVLIPLPCHWRARNIPTLSLIFWLTAVNFPRVISTIIWAGNTNDSAPVWCDIVTRLFIGANWAFAASTVPLCRYLAHVSSPYHRAENARERHRRMIFEIVMCGVLPLIGMALYYVVQHHRYDIYEDFGCFPAYRSTVAAILIVNVPPVIFSLITLVYAAIALRWFIQRRAQFEASLQSNNSGLKISRYLRLVLFSVTLMLAGTGMTTFVLINVVVDNDFEPWVSWEFVHADWNSIDQLARDLGSEAPAAVERICINVSPGPDYNLGDPAEPDGVSGAPRRERHSPPEGRRSTEATESHGVAGAARVVARHPLTKLECKRVTPRAGSARSGELRAWLKRLTSESSESPTTGLRSTASNLVPEAYWNSTLVVWYLVPITSVIFFAFFGCVGEVRVEYMGYFEFIKTRVLRIKYKPQPVLPTSTPAVELQSGTASQILDKPDHSSGV